MAVLALCWSCCALLFATLLALGTWQVQRLAWKEALIATIEAAHRTLRPRRLPRSRRSMPRTGDVDYRPVTANGHVPPRRRAPFPRHLAGPVRLLRLYAARTGRRAVRLRQPRLRSLRPEGPGQAAAGPDRRARSTVTGLARNPLATSRPRCVPDNDPAKNIFYWKDLDAMGRAPACRRATDRAVLHRRRRRPTPAAFRSAASR